MSFIDLRKHKGAPRVLTPAGISLPARGWTPRPDQLPLWRYFQNGGLRATEVAHRRWGKDEIALNWTSVSACDVGYDGCRGRVGNYWHMLPKASQARKAIWEAVNPRTGKRRIDEAFPEALRARTVNHEMMIKFKCGSTWQVVGSDNYDMLVGSPPVGIVFSEWALAKPGAWAMLRPILDENGGWALFITTPRGRNHALKTLNMARKESDWFAEVVDARKSGVFSKQQLEKILRELQQEWGEEDGQALYDQEYMCSFDAQLLGAYYAKQLANMQARGQILPFIKHDPNYPVQTAWDIGLSDDTAIWFFQVIGREVRVLGFYSNRNQLIDYYAKVLETFQNTMGWRYWFNDPREAYHWVPWDARPKTLASKGKSLIEIAWEDHEMRLRVAKNLSKQDGIQATRKMLERTYISEKLSTKGLECVRNYKREWDEERQMFKNEPEHDWTSHAADALRIMGVSYQHVPGRRGVEVKRPRAANEMTFNELVAKTQNQHKDDYID